MSFLSLGFLPWLSILGSHSTPPTTNQLQILYPALVRSLITLPKCLMIKITPQSNSEQALSSLFFLQLSVIAPSRCYSILMKCRQLTNQLLRAKPYYLLCIFMSCSRKRWMIFNQSHRQGWWVSRSPTTLLTKPPPLHPPSPSAPCGE